MIVNPIDSTKCFVSEYTGRLAYARNSKPQGHVAFQKILLLSYTNVLYSYNEIPEAADLVKRRGWSSSYSWQSKARCGFGSGEDLMVHGN